MTEGEQYSKLLRQISVPKPQLNSPLGQLAQQLNKYIPNQTDIQYLDSIRTWILHVPVGVTLLAGALATRYSKRSKSGVFIIFGTFAGVYSSSLYASKYYLRTKLDETGYGNLLAEWHKMHGEKLRLSHSQLDEWLNGNKELVMEFTKINRYPVFDISAPDEQFQMDVELVKKRLVLDGYMEITE
ncbi:hypothetical protein HDV01_001207 [Terramyces sp. JEL0728]|nr:hypothetical protein HDV01_001207 [Terramyces sp. JEL0728]